MYLYHRPCVTLLLLLLSALIWMLLLVLSAGTITFSIYNRDFLYFFLLALIPPHCRLGTVLIPLHALNRIH